MFGRRNRYKTPSGPSETRGPSYSSAQHLSRFDTPRRLATLVVFAREMEAILTDAALVMFDKMLGGVYRRADRAYRENVVHRASSRWVGARAS